MTAREVLQEIEQRAVNGPVSDWDPRGGDEPHHRVIERSIRFKKQLRADNAALLAALRAVLDEHHPDRADGGQTCSRCGDWSDGYDVGGMFVAIEMAYPCPTVRAITDALSGVTTRTDR